MRPPGHLAGRRRLLLPLLLLISEFAQQCFAEDPRFKFRGPADSAQSDEELEFDFSGEQIAVNLHPVSGHRLEDALFEPRRTLDMHFIQLEDKKRPTLLQTTLEHQHHDYVNLESIEPFLVEPVTCRMAKEAEETDLDLHFKTMDGFAMAREHWARDLNNASTIRFVMEGPYCFQAAGARSVYHSTALRFDADRKRVVIKAVPLHASIYLHTDWTHEITVKSYRHRPEEHRIQPRASLLISYGMHLV